MAYNQKPEYGSKPDLGHWSMRGSVLSLPVLGKLDLYDYSGNQHKATNNGATAAVGDNGHALEFVGSQSDFISGPVLGVTAYPVTIETYAMATDVGTARPFNVGNLAEYADYFALDIAVGTDWTYWFRNSSGSLVVSGSPEVGRMYHMVGVSASSNDHKLYIDGDLAGSSTTTTTFPSGIDGFGVGALVRDSNIDSSCVVSFARFYNRALTATEIKSLYETPWQAWQKDDTLLWAAQAQGSVNLLDGLFARKSLIA